MVFPLPAGADLAGGGAAGGSHGGVLAAGWPQVAARRGAGGPWGPSGTLPGPSREPFGAPPCPLCSHLASLPLASYIRYSQICAQAVRAAMKPQYKAEAERAAMATVKTVKPKKE